MTNTDDAGNDEGYPRKKLPQSRWGGPPWWAYFGTIVFGILYFAAIVVVYG